MDGRWSKGGGGGGQGRGGQALFVVAEMAGLVRRELGE